MKRRQEAIDALRRARATAECGPSFGVAVRGCALENWDFEFEELICVYDEKGYSLQRRTQGWHEATASALLDGLSVADVTSAEEALDG